MTNLNEYLDQKRAAIRERRLRAETEPAAPHQLRAHVRAEGRSGIRRIQIRDFQVISDSGPDFAGYNLGPSSPELQLGVLGSCLTHVFLIQAAILQVPLDSLEVDVTGEMDARAGKPGFEDIPIYPHHIHYTIQLTSPASAEEIAALHAAVEKNCPVYNLLRNPQTITSSVEHTRPELATVAA